jgi:hypothetical protein
MNYLNLSNNLKCLIMDKTNRNRFTYVGLGFIIVILMLFFSFIAKSQDRIITTGGDTIKCYIVFEDIEFIHYKFNKQDVTVLQINKSFVKQRIEDINKPNVNYLAGQQLYLAGSNFNAAIVLNLLGTGIISYGLSTAKTENDLNTYLYVGLAFDVLAILVQVAGNNKLKNAGIILSPGGVAYNF